MIDVKNLTKIYRSDKTEVVALNSVSFHLPDKGFVFIVGKSGSGKSTLLNMLGVLDDVTSGEIIFDGKNISQISDHDANAYRNSDLGIVYQNYNLFEDESVKDNIKLGIGTTEKTVSEEKVDELLKVVDLEDIKTKKVKNLSGGQKQRIAIARALVKDPKLILADEPTGNLDGKTAKLIFDLFKKISHDKLVVVITHDIKSAYEYADRIIRLQDGQITEDLVRNKNFKETLNEQNIYIDSNDEITEEEIAKINKKLWKSHRNLKKLEKRFSPYNAPEVVQEVNNNFTYTKMCFRQVLKMGLKVLKHNKFSLIVTSILTVVIIALMSLSTTFINFEGTAATKDVVEIYDAKSIVMKKGFYLTSNANEVEKDYAIETTEADLTKLKQEKYEGNTYKIYNTSFPCKSDQLYEISQSVKNSSDHFYWEAGSGVVVADMSLLNKLFGKNFELAAGSLYGLDSNHKIIIPDYLADSILYYQHRFRSLDENDPYSELIDNPKLTSRYRIGAVIKTDYKTRHKAVYDMHKKVEKGLVSAQEAKHSIEKSRAFQVYQDDVMSRLNFGYSINPNYFEAYSQNKEHAYLGISFLSLSEDAKPSEYMQAPAGHIYKNKDLEKDDIKISVAGYNAIFGTSITSSTDADFAEKTIYIQNFGIEQDIFSTPKHVTKVVIKDVFKADSGPLFYCSAQKLVELQDFYQINFAYMFDNVYEGFKLYQTLSPEGFYCNQNSFSAVFKTVDIAAIFGRIFKSIFIVLVAIELLLVVLHVNKTINKEKYTFGVFKTLGYSNGHLIDAVLIANVATMLIVFTGAILSTALLSLAANLFLQGGFYIYTHNALYLELSIVSFNIIHVLIYSAIVLAFIAGASLIPLLKIRKIKPTNIIREAK